MKCECGNCGLQFEIFGDYVLDVLGLGLECPKCHFILKYDPDYSDRIKKMKK
jgi:hypothetical protein